MARRQLTSEQLLKQIGQETSSRKAVAAAERILNFGDSLQAQRIGRQASISVRLPGPERHNSWLTLFLIQRTGKLTVWYAYLWERIGLPEAVADRYENRMVKLFGPDIKDRGVPVTDVVTKWAAFVPIVGDAADAVNEYVRRASGTPAGQPTSRALSALEGLVTEARVYRYSRSRALRDKAMRDSGGYCSCCEVPFGELLGGRGRHVLQVHHRHQLSQKNHPKPTRVNDLAVVCANCHMLIHADPEAALAVEAVRALWRKHRAKAPKR